MLEEINIENLGLIEKANLTFTPGLNVITGETGAGKTMVLTALGLLLGKRANANMIRHGATHVSVEGCWTVKEDNPITPKIKDTGAVFEEDGELFINRTVKQDGKSRIVVGGKTTPVGVLTGFSGGLVNIHGQSDQIRLKTSTAQREALDRYAGVALAQALDEYTTQYKIMRDLERRLKDEETNSVHRLREYELYRQAVEDFKKVQPVKGEDDALKAELVTLTHVETIREATITSHNSFTSEDTGDDYQFDVISKINDSYKALSGVADYDPKLKSLLEQLDSIRISVEDFVAEISQYVNDIDAESVTRLEEVQERISVLNNLTRKYGPTLDDAITYWGDAEKQVELLNPETNNVETLKKQYDEALVEAAILAGKVTRLRHKASDTLSEAVNTELAGLAMAGNKLVISLVPLNKLTSHGTEEVHFLLQTMGNPNPQPIAKTASGGELSRIMLALEVVLADPTTTETFVYDEVDAGVGGAVAIEIGKRLSRLARDAQVIVVTHLAQVAAFADNHLKVNKTASETFVNTDVRTLNQDEQVVELTRLLSGLEDSDTGQAHALELKTLAREQKTLTL